MRNAIVLLVCLGLAGCAATDACEVISPPPAMSPTAQDDQRVEMQSTGDPTEAGDEMQRCP
jgi:hypothetical protein